MKKPDNAAQAGQALLVVILATLVAATVGISIISRSITTVRISTAQEDSQRAFAAAEAGIEEVLKTKVAVGSPTVPITLPNNSSYFASVVSPSSAREFLLPGTVSKDDVVQIWLSNYSGCATPPCYGSPYSGSITIYWNSPSDSCPSASALEVAIFSGSTTSPALSRLALDPCSRGSFTPVVAGGTTMQDVTFSNGYTTSITNGLIMRITPLYKGTRLGVMGTKDLPSQGTNVESTGQVTSGAETVIRKIRIFQSNPSLPSAFDHAVFGGTGL